MRWWGVRVVEVRWEVVREETGARWPGGGGACEEEEEGCVPGRQAHGRGAVPEGRRLRRAEGELLPWAVIHWVQYSIMLLWLFSWEADVHIYTDVRK